MITVRRKRRVGQIPDQSVRFDVLSVKFLEFRNVLWF